MSDLDQFFADRPAAQPTLLELVAFYGTRMAAAERAIRHGANERAATLAVEAQELYTEIGRRYRAAQALTTYTDRATVMETLDGQA